MLPAHWPKWSLILIAFGLIAFAIVAGIALEPVGLALAPAITPVPTLQAIGYARPISDACVQCHLDKELLLASADSPDKAESSLIQADSLNTPHGSLGCITCHGGTGETPDKDLAHEGLVADLSESHPSDCLLCHRNLPDQIPEDHLRTPHGQIVNAVWEGSACGVKCSDCHGAVGHGFDPVTGETICSMSVCMDCHQKRNLATALTDCSTCHVGPHDIALAMSCKDCHTSTETWNETALQVHPIRLVGKHATLECFSCHEEPNFKGLDSVCSDCHEATHEVSNDNCALCHSPEGWAESAASLVSGASNFPHPAKGQEDCRSCHGVSGQLPMSDAHKGRTNDTCQVCHQPAPAAAILHPIEDHEGCLTCHGEKQAAQFPLSTHAGRDEASCTTCHAPAGVTPLDVSHGMEGRADCLGCHDAEAMKPYPATHEGWGNELCLLCHKADSQPTEAVHTFPQDHNATAQNCEFCHPSGDFSTYRCDTCHAQTGMNQIHSARGIAEIENKCVLCHPKGEKP